MSGYIMNLPEPLSPAAAKVLIRTILAVGQVGFSNHAREEMAKDSRTEIDVVNVLRGGAGEAGRDGKGILEI